MAIAQLVRLCRIKNTAYVNHVLSLVLKEEWSCLFAAPVVGLDENQSCVVTDSPQLPAVLILSSKTWT